MLVDRLPRSGCKICSRWIQKLKMKSRPKIIRVRHNSCRLYKSHWFPILETSILTKIKMKGNIDKALLRQIQVGKYQRRQFKMWPRPVKRVLRVYWRRKVWALWARTAVPPGHHRGPQPSNKSGPRAKNGSRRKLKISTGAKLSPLGATKSPAVPWYLPHKRKKSTELTHSFTPSQWLK